MTKEALKLALEALEEAADAIDSWGSYASGYFQVKHDLENDISNTQQAITAIKAALEANEFNPDWDTQAVLVEEIQRMAKRIEELEAKDEPVAWINAEKRTFEWNGPVLWSTPTVAVLDKIPLYTAPSQRTWVGLTTDERRDLCRSWSSPMDAIYATETKLKEKNT